MKNLKKTLCLILVLAMALSLFAVSAGAAFTDSSDIKNIEAATVLNELGVLTGFEDGSYQAETTLTRAQAATILARMLLGPTDADKMTATAAPFDDVPASHWAAGYIAYCVSENIIAGYGDGTFGPDDTLTVYQFSKMLLCALGYNAATEGFTGATWALAVAKYALSLGLLDDVVGNYDEGCTRGDAAQAVLNTLMATMVYYPSGSTVVTTGDTTVTIGGSAETKEAGNKYDGNIYDDDYLQFAENYFTKLVLSDSAENAFGRPATFAWKLGDDTIYTGVDDTDMLASYTSSVTRGALYTLIGSSAYKDLDNDDADLTVFVDGEEVTTPTLANYFTKSSSTNATGTGRGVLTEVYMNDDGDVTIVEINTYLAVADSDYDDDDETLDITVYNNGDVDNETLSLDDFDIDGYEEDDYLLVTVNDGEIYSVEAASTVSGEISGYTSNSSITVGGSKYNYSAKMNTTEFPRTGFSIDSDIVLVLDSYGFVIGYTDVETTSQYVYITEIAQTGSLSSAGYVAAAYFTDGTYDEVTLKSVAGDTIPETGNTLAGWYSYSVNSAGKYVLTAAKSTDVSGKTYATRNGYVQFVTNSGVAQSTFKATSSTVFIVLDEDGDFTTYTGYSHVPTINKANAYSIEISALKNSSGYCTYVFIYSGDATVTGGTTTNSDVIYIYDSSASVSVDSSKNTYYSYSALVNGVKTTVNCNTTMTPGMYTDVTYDSYGYIDSATEVTVNIEDEFTVQTVTTEDAITYTSGIISIGDEDYVLADSYSIFMIDLAEEDYESISQSKLVKQSGTIEGTVYGVIEDDAVVGLYVVPTVDD